MLIISAPWGGIKLKGLIEGKTVKNGKFHGIEKKGGKIKSKMFKLKRKKSGERI